MVWVRERTIPTERPPLVGEAIANFCGQRVPHGQRDGSLRPYSLFSRQELLRFYQVAPQLYSRGWVDPVPDPLLFFLVVPRIEPGPPDLLPRTLTTRPQRLSTQRFSKHFQRNWLYTLTPSPINYSCSNFYNTPYINVVCKSLASANINLKNAGWRWKENGKITCRDFYFFMFSAICSHTITYGCEYTKSFYSPLY
jgi:hypothetical protein